MGVYFGILVSVGTGVLVKYGVSVGGTRVAVGGTGVLVGGTKVFVGGIGVFVGGIEVFVGGTGVSVGGLGVLVGGTGVLVGGLGVFVGTTQNDPELEICVGALSATAGVVRDNITAPTPNRARTTKIVTVKEIANCFIIFSFFLLYHEIPRGPTGD